MWLGSRYSVALPSCSIQTRTAFLAASTTTARLGPAFVRAIAGDEPAPALFPKGLTVRMITAAAWNSLPSICLRRRQHAVQENSHCCARVGAHGLLQARQRRSMALGWAMAGQGCAFALQHQRGISTQPMHGIGGGIGRLGWGHGARLGQGRAGARKRQHTATVIKQMVCQGLSIAFFIAFSTW